MTNIALEKPGPLANSTASFSSKSDTSLSRLAIASADCGCGGGWDVDIGGWVWKGILNPSLMMLMMFGSLEIFFHAPKNR